MQPKLENSSNNELTDEATTTNRPRPKPGPRPKPTPPASATPWITYVGLFVAVLALFSFGLLIMYMLTRASGATELEWQRDVYLLSGVEAVAFAAAGFLFGKEIHRQQAAQATTRADKAEEKAAEAQQNAQLANRTAIEVRSRARALTAAINAKAEGYAQEAQTRHVSTPAPTESMAPMAEQTPQPPAAQPSSSQADLLELQRLAKELFP